MENNLISVIVPVYKAEQYIRRCIESIQAQTYRNIEIILVDDGSPDCSGEICDCYADTDERIHVIHQENKGVSEARNMGIRAASGQYLSFVDSDDFVHKDYCRMLLKLSEEFQAPMAVCGFKRIQTDNLTLDNADYKVIVRNKKEAMKHLIQNESTNYVWGRVYRKELFEGLEFEEGRIYEDIAIMFQLVERCSHIVYTEAPYYGYFDNLESLIQCVNTETLYQVLMSWKEQYLFCVKKYPDLTEHCLRQILHYYLLIYSYTTSLNDIFLKKAKTLIKGIKLQMYKIGDLNYKIKYLVTVVCPIVFPIRNYLKGIR